MTQSYRDVGLDPEYLFKVTDELYIDGNRSEHFSHYFNHEEHSSLNFTIDEERARVDFYAARPIAIGDELTFDYGVGYWTCGAAKPAPGTDSRNFTLREWQPPPLAGPPPLIPRSTEQLAAALRLGDGEARAALLRSLEFFGGERLATDLVEIPLRLPPLPGEAAVDSEELRARVDPQRAPLDVLEAAARRCVTEAERRSEVGQGG